MSRKPYPGTLEFITYKEPAQVFDKVKAISAALGQEIKVVYKGPVHLEDLVVAVNAQSTKKDFKSDVRAAFNKSLNSIYARDSYLLYRPSGLPYKDVDKQVARLDKLAQEIANKIGETVAYQNGERFTGNFIPERKKPSSTARHQL